MKSGASSTAATPATPPLLPVAARRHTLVAGLARGLRERCAFSGGSIVVGVSGGSDSAALLAALLVLRDRAPGDGARAIEPVAAHVHHNLRGGDADGDAQMVVDLCRRLRVPLRVEHVRPGDEPGNLAANARAMRYDALRRVAASVGAGAVAVAHHADDQLETMLIAIGRGSGLAGLGAMAWARALSGNVRLLRPLLSMRHAECEDFCRAAAITWRHDPTNDDRTRARARLRHDVLPVLEELWPDAARRAAGTADAVAAARAAFAREVESIFGPAQLRSWPRTALARRSLVTITAGLRRAALDAAPGVGDALGQRLLNPAAETIRAGDRRPHRFDWPGGLRLTVTARAVTLSVRR